MLLVLLGLILVGSVLVYAAVDTTQAYHDASQIRLSDGRSLQDYVSGTSNGIDVSQPYHNASQFLLADGKNIQDYVSYSPSYYAGDSISLKAESTIRNACHKDVLYEFRINVNGAVRVTADVQTAKNQYATLKIYRNGDYVGKFDEVGNIKRTKSADTSGWSEGDKMQIKVESNRGSDYYYAMCISNLKITTGGVSSGSTSGINSNLDNHVATQIELLDGRTAQEYVDSNSKSAGSASVDTLERKGVDISYSNPSCGRYERYMDNPCRVLSLF